jgi:hypothetical protein
LDIVWSSHVSQPGVNLARFGPEIIVLLKSITRVKQLEESC